jgi:hypothetical protein
VSGGLCFNRLYHTDARQSPSLEDNIQEKALQTVAQGQKAENLLDFDMDEPAAMADTSISASAFANAPSGSQSASVQQALAKNPLDELMDLFATNTLTAPTTTSMATSSPSPFGMASSPASALSAASITPAPVKPDAFSGLDDFGFGAAPSKPAPKTMNSSQNDDLLGLF